MLEEAIKENTATMRELIAHLQAGARNAILSNPPANVITTDEVKANLAAAKPAATPPAAAPAAGTALSYEAHVKPLVLDLGKATNRDTVVGLLKEFGAESAVKLTAEQWPAFIEKAKALIAAAPKK